MRGLFENSGLPRWLLVIFTLIFFLRIPSFFEPYFYGDEMIYLSLGEGVRQNLTLYKDIHDNKPPLLYITAAIAGNLFWFKVILCFWNILTIYFFYKLAESLFGKNILAGKISTLIFAVFTTIPLLEGNIVNAELFMIGFTIAAFYLLFKKPEPNLKTVYIAGLLTGMAALFKIPAAFEVPAVVVFWILTGEPKKLKALIGKSAVLFLGFATPVIITFFWYAAFGIFGEYLRAAFMQNVGYLSSFRPGDIQKPFYIKNGPLLIRAAIVLIGVSALWVFRKKLSGKFVFLTIWCFFALFAVTLSERPYPHYLIQVVPAASLLFGIFVAEKSLAQSLTVIPLALTVFVPVYYNFYHYPTFPYYQRFFNFVIGKTDRGAYLQSFSANTIRNYDLAEFLINSSKKDDKVFMWDSDSAVVYALSRRLPPIKYVADYHINDFAGKKAVALELSTKLPKFIILTSGNNYPELSELLKDKYLLITQIHNANVYSRIDFAPKPQ